MTTSIRSVGTYVIAEVPVVADLRKISGVVLIEDAPIAVIRKISGVALTIDVSKAYLKMKGSVALLTAINKEHGKSLTAQQVSFADPVPTDDHSSDTSVAMIPAPDWLYSGQMVFRYERHQLSEMMRGEALTLPPGSQTTVHARLPAINAQFSSNLEPRDIVDGPVSPTAVGLTLRVASTSHLFTPGCTVRLGSALEDNDLTLRSPVTNLAGFDAEG